MTGPGRAVLPAWAGLALLLGLAAAGCRRPEPPPLPSWRPDELSTDPAAGSFLAAVAWSSEQGRIEEGLAAVVATGISISTSCRGGASRT